MRGDPPISRVYSLGEPEKLTPAEQEARNFQVRKEMWHNLGVAVIDPEDINDDIHRQALINSANKLYGHRRAVSSGQKKEAGLKAPRIPKSKASRKR